MLILIKWRELEAGGLIFGLEANFLCLSVILPLEPCALVVALSMTIVGKCHEEEDDDLIFGGQFLVFVRAHLELRV